MVDTRSVHILRAPYTKSFDPLVLHVHRDFHLSSSHLPIVTNVAHIDLVLYPTMSSAVDFLDDTHYSSLLRAVANVVDTELALDTYRQILDGVPTEEVAWDRSRHKLQASHPIADHKELCPGVSDRLNTIKGNFTVDSLKFEGSVSIMHPKQASTITKC